MRQTIIRLKGCYFHKIETTLALMNVPLYVKFLILIMQKLKRWFIFQQCLHICFDDLIFDANGNLSCK